MNHLPAAPIASKKVSADPHEFLKSELNRLLFNFDRCRISRNAAVTNIIELTRPTSAAPLAGGHEPFMYGIMGPDGEAYLDENCASVDVGLVMEEVNALNDSPDAGYQVVPLFTAAPSAPAIQVTDDVAAFEDWLYRVKPTGNRYAERGSQKAWELWQRFSAAPAQPAHITLTGHQLHHALDLINPDDPLDCDQLDDDLTFGVRQHQDDDGTIRTGMCCWNDDTDGVLPLDGEYTASPAEAAAADEFARGIIAALEVLNAHGYSHGTVYHDEIVASAGEESIYRAAEDEDYSWAGLDPAKKPSAAPRKEGGAA